MRQAVFGTNYRKLLELGKSFRYVAIFCGRFSWNFCFIRFGTSVDNCLEVKTGGIDIPVCVFQREFMGFYRLVQVLQRPGAEFAIIAYADKRMRIFVFGYFYAVNWVLNLEIKNLIEKKEALRKKDQAF